MAVNSIRGESPRLIHPPIVESSLRRPRHPEIRDELVRKICRDLGIDSPKHT